MTQPLPLVIGVGSSAGGLQAFTQLVEQLPSPLPAALVWVQHLPKGEQTTLQDIISQRTTIPVRKIRQGEAPEANHIYLSPDSEHLRLREGRFHLSSDAGQNPPHHSIDTFFQSLAEVFGEQSIGVILSGGGSDGSRGVAAISQVGGTVLVQEPETAQFDFMPQAALETADALRVLPPDQLADEVTRLLLRQKDAGSIAPLTFTEADWQALLEPLERQTGLLLRAYKPSALERWLAREMALRGIKAPAAFAEWLQSNPKEAVFSGESFLVGVTEFFRNPEAFGALAGEVIPALFSTGEPLRIWTPGCSTGQEPYSLAVLLEEYRAASVRPTPYQIFATDASGEALGKAAAGLYAVPDEAVQQRLAPYFTSQDEYVKVTPEIRRNLVFARHDLLKDPPFVNMHLVVCRNLFIYLKPEAQQRLLLTFHRALKPGGFLFLGANESLPDIRHYFEPVSSRWKIYRRRAVQLPYLPPSAPTGTPPHSALPAGAVPTRTGNQPLMHHYEKLLVSRYAPSLVLVNQALEVVYTHGRFKHLLTLPEGTVRLDLLAMVPPTLQPTFRNGIRKIQIGAERAVYRDIVFEGSTGSTRLDLTFVSLKSAGTEPLVLIELVELEAVPAQPGPDAFTSQTIQEERYQDLEYQLQHTQQQLQFTVTELETANEELQSSNEELLSANEELQSTNEELESANEELYSLNQQLQDKIAQLNELHADLSNLFEATQVGTLFVDRELKVRKFTPQVKTYFNLLDSDIGRPLAHVTSNFEYPALLEEAGEVLRSLRPLEREVLSRQEHYYLVRLLPYKAPLEPVSGVVITFVDITELKKVHHSLLRLTDELRRRSEALERAEQGWHTLVDNIPDAIVRYDGNLVVTVVNEGFVRETGVTAAQLVGKSAFEISRGLNRDESWPRALEQVLRTRTVQELSITYLTPRGEQYYYSIMVPELSADGREVESVLTISHNVTALKQYERQLQQSEQLWRGLVDNTPDVISRYDRSLHLVFVNKAAEQEFGVPAGALLGKNPFQFSVRTAGTQAFVDKLEAAFRTGKMQHHVSEAESTAGKKYFLSTIVPEWGTEPEPESVLLISRNITDLKRTENELRETEALIRQQNQELQKANEYLDNFVYAAAHDLRAPVANLSMLTKMLQDLHLDGKAGEYAGVMLTTVRRLDQTLKGLVEVLEVQSTFQTNVKWVAFGQVLAEVKAEMVTQLEAASAQVEGDFDATPGMHYIPAYVTSIFRNLISNAVKYRVDDRSPVISITASRQQSHVLLEFRDNGMGIDLKRLGDKLFKPFSRLTTRAEGKGIGLHLVRSMIEKNGGRIEVESIVNGGTIFKCYLHEYQLPQQKNDTLDQ